MARAGVTYFDIAQAAEAIKGRGEEPTVDRVRAELGTGSKSTIAPLLKRWRAEAGEEVDTGGLPKDLVDALRGLHERVQQEAEIKVREFRSCFEADAERLQAAMAEIQTLNTRLKEELDDLTNQLEISEEQNRTLKEGQEQSRLALAKAEIQREEGALRIAELQHTMQELKQESRDIRQHFEHFQQRTADDRERERDQFRRDNAQLQGHLSTLKSQLATTELKFSECRDAYERQQQSLESLTEERQQMLQQLVELRAEGESLRQRLVEQQDLLAERHTEIESQRGKFTVLASEKVVLEKEIALLKASAGKLETALASERQKAEHLVDENRVILQEKAILQGQFNQLERSLQATQTES